MQVNTKSTRAVCLALSVCAGLTACQKTEPKQTDNASHVPAFWPKLDIVVKQSPAVEERVANLLENMTVEQKVAQLIQPEIRDITVEDMRRYGFGSYLNGGGAFPDNNKHATPADWIALAESLYQASIDASLDGSSIPTMWGTDAVHGHNNVIGATLFPHNIGLGAANNPALIEQIANATAQEVMATGIDWVFAPTVATARDDRWGRTYESYSEDPDIVREYAASIVKGLQGSPGNDFLGDEKVISTVKHFIGDGGTDKGDDQGNNLASESNLFKIHAQGYVGGLTAGAQSVMASFNSWQGDKLHGHKYLLTDVLKDRMGFDGFVVGDWNGHGQITGCSNESCPDAINAGLDIFMVPTGAWKPLLENTIRQVNDGTISMERLNDAVTRVLRVKVRAGLFEKPSPANRPLAGRLELIGHEKHREVAVQAVRESLVLLKNNNQILPLAPTQHILVAGDGADNIGKQSGGWTISWQGTGNQNSDFPGGTSIYAGIEQAVTQAGGSVELSANASYQQKPDVAVVVFGEEPYAEGNGDLDNLEYQRGKKSDLAMLKALHEQGIPVVSVFLSGRPMWVNAELNASDAFVAAWLPGSEGQGVADVIIADADGKARHDFKGKLSFSWPAAPAQAVVNRHDSDYAPLLPYGYGLKYGEASTLSNELAEEIHSDDANTLPTLALFDRSVQAPWSIYAGSEGDSQQMASSVFESDNMHVRTIDRRVQEDALLLTWKSANPARLSLAASFPEDLLAYSEAKGALSFQYRVDSSVPDTVQLEMRCDGLEQACSGGVDISEALSSTSGGEWQSLSIDLACFTQQGVNLGKVMSPFSLSAEQNFTLAISDITIVPKGAATASLSCQ